MEEFVTSIWTRAVLFPVFSTALTLAYTLLSKPSRIITIAESLVPDGDRDKDSDVTAADFRSVGISLCTGAWAANFGLFISVFPNPSGDQIARFAVTACALVLLHPGLAVFQRYFPVPEAVKVSVATMVGAFTIGATFVIWS